MFVLSNKDNAVYRVVAILVSLALIMWSVFLQMPSASAANLIQVSNTLSTSAPATASDHEIQFTIPTGSAGVEAGESIIVTFPNGFNVSTSGALIADYDLEVNGTDEAIAADGAALGADWGIATSGQTLTFTSGTDTIGAGATVTIKIGSNADAGTTRITNPTATGSYEFSITSGDGANNDSADTRVVVIDQVTVTASVPTQFEFVVSGFNTSGVAVNGTSTTGTTTATAIPFGDLFQDVPETLAQRLNVTTNARYGFVVTLEQDRDLTSSTGAEIDSFTDNTATNTPRDWRDPAEDVNDANTWGHFGMTSSDDINSTEFQNCPLAVTDGCWIAASTSPRAIFSHTGPADGTTANIGSTTIGYRAEITPLQEAGDDYENTLTYIATPTF